MSGLGQDRIHEIVHRHSLEQSARSIARAMHLSRRAVQRILDEHAAGREQGTPHPDMPRLRSSRGSAVDAHQEAITVFLNRYPNITVVRLLEELRALGYQGGYTVLRERVKELRSQTNTPLVQRFETAAGMQAQMDWAVYTLDFSTEGCRRVNLFSYVLGYSRRQYLRFTESQDFETLLREHVRAFEHLGGMAATCLYDNMKTVVDRWESGEPVYNVRFLAFAAHYGFRPLACWPRRPQTKGKVERPFQYVESNLLNGRTFSSLEHLNQTTQHWLANTADLRVHRETRKRPIDAHAEELPHLLPLPAAPYDTARFVYRTVDAEGMISYERNLYSAPWRLVGRMLPVRVTEEELILYDCRSLKEVGRHVLVSRHLKGQRQVSDAHRPSRNTREQEDVLRERFAELGETAVAFLEGLLRSHRDGKHQARKVLSLVSMYHGDDVRAAIERAVRYRAFSCNSLERILAVQARPRPPLDLLNEQYRPSISDDEPVGPRPTADYQELLEEPDDDDQPPQKDQ
ncbi:MAG TPA: IS21 family transposase [Gemmataceae bacterium]|jgi:transposase|nr:IS21 family transposase [Gemmataceae bacterium]